MFYKKIFIKNLLSSQRIGNSNLESGLNVRCLFSSSLIKASERVKDFDSIPGPKSYPIIKNILSFKKYGGHLESSYPLLVLQLQKEYGNLVKFSIARKPEIYVYDPESIEKVFMLNEKNPSKKKFEPWIMYFDYKKKAQTLNNSDGARWRKLRSAINPTLARPQSVVKHLPSEDKIVNEFVDFVKHKIDQSTDKKSIVIADFDTKIEFLILELVSHASFGKKIVAVDDRVSTKETKEFIEVLHEFVFRMSRLMGSSPIWKYVSTKKWREFVNTTDRFINFVNGYVEDALNDIDSEQRKGSVVKYMIENKEKYNITIEDIQSTLYELFTGGVESTSATLHFALYNLGSNKKIQDEIYAEIKCHLKAGHPLDEQVLANLKYLKAFVKEVLRYYPVAISLGRVAVENMVLNGYNIPKGTFMNVVSGVTSRLDSVFDNASKFDPKRWLDPNRKYHRFALTSFGYGSRNCVARRISEQIIYVTLIKIIENFEIEYKGEEFGFINAVFSRPDKPLSLKLTKRTI